ncbi:THAP domain-containing protein 1-like isoform X1 [Acyrthosiphon pisum]|uniref:THAP-type domain-containing protein n=1 Tax=Acyrthosiphon pisum TaxID=7029 RepID=A0A8R2NQ83_ACYPI|nr:THAP domain-containing protein 1-like isoform X1 [Acyrthosiphon pisum]XP_029343205.1 THAP domain-containing protein 1-like isoform X1 [Acyrthosiphon pisum]
MPSCFLCKRSWSAKKTDVSFHRLPADEPRKRQWIQFFEDCGADTTKIKPLTSICSEHFDSDCFKNYVRSKLLKEDAIPSIVVKRLKYAKTTVPEVKVSISDTSTSTCLEGVELEGFGKLPDLPCDVQSSPLNSFSLKRPSEKSQSLDVMIQASVSESYDTPRRTFLKRSVSSLVDMCNAKDKKMKVLKQRLRRQKKTIVSLKNVINTLKAKLLIDQEQAHLLDSHFGKHKDLIRNFVNKNAGKKFPKRYSMQLCKFAVTQGVHICS